MSSPIALVLGPEEFVAAQRRRGKTEWVACRGGDLDDAGLRRVSEMLERGGMRGRRVRLAPPDAATIMSLIELPPRASGAPVDVLAGGELARIMRAQGGDLMARALDVPQPARRGASQWYLGAGVMASEGERLARALARIGLRVEHIEPRAIALGAAFAGILSRSGVSAGMEVSASQSRFVAVVDGRLAYERAIPLGWLSEPTSALARSRQVTARAAEASVRGAMNAAPETWSADVRGAIEGTAAALAREFVASATFAMERYRADALADACVIGPGALGLGPVISARLGSPVREGAWGVTPAEASPGLGSAVGLLAQEGARCLPPALSAQRALRRRVVQASWATGTAAVLAVGSWLSVVLSPAENLSTLIAEVGLMDETTDGLSAEISHHRAELTTGVQSLRAGRAAQDRVDWTPLLVGLADIAGEDVRLTHVGAAPTEKGARVSVRGTAKDQAGLSRFVLALEGTGAFARVDLHDSNAGSEGAITFSLSAMLGEERP